MRLAQRLYEGVDIGGETVGLITYMRTDGFDIAPEALTAARRMIEREYGARYMPDAPRRYHARRSRTRRKRTRRSARPTSAASPPTSPASSIRPGAALRADLEAHDREPDGLRRA